MSTAILAAIISLASSVIGGTLVAVVNYFLTKKKTDAEVAYLNAQTSKTLGEMKHKRRKKAFLVSTKANEEIIYDGRKGIKSSDIRSSDSDYDLESGVLVIHNGDWDSYELQTYAYNGKARNWIPKDVTTSGTRRIHVVCEAKVIGAPYEVSAFLWETPEPEDDRDPSIDDRSIKVSSGEWKELHYYFSAPRDKNYMVHIGAERISGQGSLQIRHLMVIERIDTPSKPLGKKPN